MSRHKRACQQSHASSDAGEPQTGTPPSCPASPPALSKHEKFEKHLRVDERSNEEILSK